MKKEKTFILHALSPTKIVSPFDINMAYDSGFDNVATYTNITTTNNKPTNQPTNHQPPTISKHQHTTSLQHTIAGKQQQHTRARTHADTPLGPAGHFSAASIFLQFAILQILEVLQILESCYCNKSAKNRGTQSITRAGGNIQ